jgi:hypothetical protein
VDGRVPHPRPQPGPCPAPPSGRTGLIVTFLRYPALRQIEDGRQDAIKRPEESESGPSGVLPDTHLQMRFSRIFARSAAFV